MRTILKCYEYEKKENCNNENVSSWNSYTRGVTNNVGSINPLIIG